MKINDEPSIIFLINLHHWITNDGSHAYFICPLAMTTGLIKMPFTFHISAILFQRVSTLQVVIIEKEISSASSSFSYNHQWWPQPTQKWVFAFLILAIQRWRVLTLHVAISEKGLSSSRSSLSCDHRLHQKVLCDFSFQHSCRECPWHLQLPVSETPKWSQINGPQSWWFDGPDIFMISHIASSCHEFLPWLLQLPVSETMKQNLCHALIYRHVSLFDQRSRSYHDFSYRELEG